MQRKYFLGSVLVTLLMLLTSIGIINTVVSDPTQHTGDAWVGDLWISELDVSGELEYVDNVGIGHAAAEDDWVLWTNWEGDIKANWSIDIDSESHPEYWVIYKLSIYNIDDKNAEVGNTTYQTTLEEDVKYNTSGTLAINVNLSSSGMGQADQTLICYLLTFIRINCTTELINFSSLADDRSVIGVSASSQEQPFSRFPDEANDDFPHMWSWIDGWEQVFSTETEMFNEQTYFNVGTQVPPSPGSNDNPTWYLGELDIDLYHTYGVASFSLEQAEIQWKRVTNSEWVQGLSRINFTMSQPVSGWRHPILFRFKLWYEQGNDPATVPSAARHVWEPGDDPDGYIKQILEAIDMNSDDNIRIDGSVWVVTMGLWFHHFLTNFNIEIIEGEVDPITTSTSTYYWEEECSYQNDSYTLSVSNSKAFGITTVVADISDILDQNEIFIYSYAGDVGDTRIQFIC